MVLSKNYFFNPLTHPPRLDLSWNNQMQAATVASQLSKQKSTLFCMKFTTERTDTEEIKQ